jgi:hypothetical protein
MRRMIINAIEMKQHKYRVAGVICNRAHSTKAPIACVDSRETQSDNG